jgi:hypothetical protein
LAALALAVALPVSVAFAQDPPPDTTGALDALPDAPAPNYPSVDRVAAQPPGRRPSGVAEKLAGWVTAVDDNGDLPFIIIDKLGAHIFVFDAEGQFLGSAPVLVGLARGDDSAPGIGNLKLSQIGPDERTTPAGRFVAEFGDSNGHGRMLWVDLPDAISLHPVMSVSPGEHRFQRIKSPDPRQHRISFGCINVPKGFYDDVVVTALASGAAVVYILPDTKAIDDVFPAFAATLGGGGGEPPSRQAGRAGLLSDPPSRVADPESSRLEPADDQLWMLQPPAP